MTLRVKVGTFTLTAVRDVSLPQEFAAWHQTVRIEPGTYDVFAYLDHMLGGTHHIEGITISSNFRSHLWGHWGKSDNNRNGTIATATIHLPTFGYVDDASPGPLLSQATLCDAIVREERDIVRRDYNNEKVVRMWRFEWKRGVRVKIDDKQKWHSGQTMDAEIIP